MEKIISVVGARPQFIKAAMVGRALKKYGPCKELLLHTGQHYDSNMSAIFFQDLDIPPPDFFLHIGSCTHGKQTGLMLEKIEEILMREQPDGVFVYGDTNSTLAAALAAAKLNIPIAHIESGLRSFNSSMPEEINRKITDHVSTWLFCPSKNAIHNLKNEGISEDKLFLVGDVMYDAALFFSKKITENSTLLTTLNITNKNYILVTIHRAENTDDPIRLKNLMWSLIALSERYTLVFPVHPRTRLVLEKYNMMGSLPASFKLIEPVGYLSMSRLEKSANLIITDSGGVQKEAYFHRVPCITVRDETEWPELMNSGWNDLCPSLEFESLVDKAEQLIDKTGEPLALYGEGNAAEKIVKYLYNIQ